MGLTLLQPWPQRLLPATSFSFSCQFLKSDLHIYYEYNQFFTLALERCAAQLGLWNQPGRFRVASVQTLRQDRLSSLATIMQKWLTGHSTHIQHGLYRGSVSYQNSPLFIATGDLRTVWCPCFKILMAKPIVLWQWIHSEALSITKVKLNTVSSSKQIAKTTPRRSEQERVSRWRGSKGACTRSRRQRRDLSPGHAH